MLSGQVTGMGTFPLSVRATAGNGTAGTCALELTVNPRARVTSTRLRAATVGGRFSATLDAEGGTPPLDWSGVSIPDGTMLDIASGRLQGMFGAAGDTKLRVRVSDANQVTTAASVEVEVHDPPEITTRSIPAFRMGQPVVFALRASGGRRRCRGIPTRRFRPG